MDATKGFLPVSSLINACCLLLPVLLPVEFFFFHFFHHTAKPTDLVTSLPFRYLADCVVGWSVRVIIPVSVKHFFFTDFWDWVGGWPPDHANFFQISWKVSAPVSGCAIFIIFILWVQKTSVNCLAAALSFARFWLETPLNLDFCCLLWASIFLLFPPDWNPSCSSSGYCSGFSLFLNVISLKVERSIPVRCRSNFFVSCEYCSCRYRIILNSTVTSGSCYP